MGVEINCCWREIICGVGIGCLLYNFISGGGKGVFIVIVVIYK